MRYFLFPLISIFSVMLISCDNDLISDSGGSNNPNDTSTTWLIPREDIFDGGPGKDGIPSIDKPKYISVDEANYLDNQNLILGIKNGSEVKAYPHPILNWHEIVNARIGDLDIAVTYCPLTGTGISWNREIDGQTTTFGVSGLLYKNNLIPYDRATGSYWSQILNQSVHGKHVRKKAETFQLVETTWQTWKKMYPNSKVLSTQTGFDRSYQEYPYGNYKQASRLLFPIDDVDERLFAKERVLGLIGNNTVKAYRFQSFNDSVRVIHDHFVNRDHVVIGSQPDNFLVAYQRATMDEQVKNIRFQPVQNAHPVVMADSSGSQWNIFGEAVSGPLKGKKLKRTHSFIGFWFIWSAFFQEAVIYGDGQKD